MHGAEHIDASRGRPAAAGHAASWLGGPRGALAKRVVGWLLLAVALLGSAQLRVRTALADPGFDAKDARRLLWSDPALLYYFTERIVENGGSAPAELRADPHFQWPDRVDALAFETVGQEYVAAWWHRAFGADQPLHWSILEAMSLAASAVAVGVFLLARELTRSTLLGGFAALLYALLPSSYRTLGMLLLREDFALPWFALHLGLLAIAARRRTAPWFAASGGALLLALATWHAMGFVVAMEAAVVLLWFLRSGENPFAVRRAWLLPAVMAVGSLAIPVLRAKLALLSLPMQAVAGLLLAQLAMRRPGAKPWHGRVAALLGTAGAAAAAALLSRALGGGIGDYSHVVRLLLAKARFLGELPADPRALDFEARLLWQGPFETSSVATLASGLGVTLLCFALLLARRLPDWWRGRGERRESLLAAFGAVTLVAAWLVARTEVVAAMAAPVIAAVVIAWCRRPALQALLAVALLATTGVQLEQFRRHWRNDWYSAPLRGRDGAITGWVAHPRQNHLPRLIEWVAAHVPAGEALAADFVTSTALLAGTRHPIVLQPKYESRESRARIEAFLDRFFRGTPDDLAKWLADHDCRWFVCDVKTLGIGSLYLAGLRDDGSEAPAAGSAAAAFLAPEPAATIGPFELRWRSSVNARAELFRVYELPAAR